MIVRQLAVGPMQNFVYLLVDESTREAMVIDSGWEIAPILQAVSEERAKVKYVVATHGHFDHISTIDELAKNLGAESVAHTESSNPHDVSVKDGDVLRIGKTDVKVLSTPGHSKDGICLYDGQNLFTGDTLFIGNCGRTDLVDSSARNLYDSLHEVIMKLPPGTVIYPGHDYGEVPSRTLGEEKKRNLVLLAPSFEDFYDIE